MSSVTRYPSLFALIFVVVGCSATSIAQEPKLIEASPEGGAILTKTTAHPRAIAQRHCAKYGKRYVLNDFERVVIAGRYEDRTYLLYFSCL
jgi:hypothetical protein